MNIISLYNIKGGVGKTAACVNLAFSCARSGLRTLVWDLDVQGASTFYFRVSPEIKGGAKKLFKKRELGEMICTTVFDRLDLLPADASYRHMDLFLDGEKKPKKRIHEFLAGFEQDYDVLFLDCPPSFSLVSENVFNASDIMLVPLIPTTLSLRTHAQILEYVAEHRKYTLRIMPFFSMVDRRKKLHFDTVAQGPESIPGLLRTQIPYLSIIENMGVNQAPVGSYAPNSEAAATFDSLWTEVLLRAKVRKA